MSVRSVIDFSHFSSFEHKFVALLKASLNPILIKVIRYVALSFYEFPGSTNEFPFVVVATPWEVARGGKLLCVHGKGSRHVCWAYSITIVVLPSGVAMVPP